MSNTCKRLGLLFAVYILHCPLGVVAENRRSNSPEIPSTEPANFAILVEGTVELKRQGWTGYAPLAFGAPVRNGDLLRVSDGSRLKVVCSDLTLRDVSSGITGIPCGESRALLRLSNGSIINPTRGSSVDGSFPIVISPRKTKLLSPHPLLRWTAVPGASTYTVIVRGPRLVWIKQVQGLEIVYPDNAPTLEPGVDYKLIVEAGGRSSSEEGGVGLGFSVIESKDRKAVQAEEKQILRLGLPDAATQFLVAHLYAANGLRAEAIDRLEHIAAFRAGAIPRFAGDLYASVGLVRQAEAQYVNSLEIANTEKDEEGQMLAHHALAGLYQKGLGNGKLATQHLQDTINLGKKLGDNNVISSAETELAEVGRKVLP